MKKFLLFITAISFFLSSTSAKEVSLEVAKKVAVTQFRMAKNISQKSANEVSLALKASTNKSTQFYVFNNNQNGFVIIAGDDKIKPILGYADSGEFNMEDLPNGLKKLLSLYKKQIQLIAQDKEISSTSEITMQWTAMKKGNAPISMKNDSIGPLVTTQWSQRPLYNKFCPTGTPSGCVATAFAQLLKYHNYPSQGKGNHSYSHDKYGTQYADFSTTTYNWNKMPNKLNSSSTTEEINEVAQLMKHAGVAVDMDYGPAGSSAYTNKVVNALEDYFSYNSSARMVNRYSYTLQSWKDMIKNQLNDSLIVLHTGFCPDPQAGHAFIIDGYNADGLFHLNWGWGGYANGYFEVNNLNPGTKYTFNESQRAIIDVVPDNETKNIHLSREIYTFDSPFKIIDSTKIDGMTDSISYNSKWEVGITVKKSIPQTINGRFRLRLLDNNSSYSEVIYQNQSNSQNLNDTSATELIFSSPNTVKAFPGSYKLVLEFAKNWTNKFSQVIFTEDDTLVTNSFKEVTIYEPLDSNIGLVLSSPIIFNNSPIKKMDTIEVTCSITNTNNTPFYGLIAMSIHRGDGTWIEDIDTMEDTIFPGETKILTFLDTAIDHNPGTYKVVAWLLTSNNDWKTIPGGSFKNNEDFDIITPDFSATFPDQYEDNDTTLTAYELNLNYVNNSARIFTLGANIHDDLDKDYFKLNFETGYNYTIYMRAHDNYNSSFSGMSFSNDVIFSTSADGQNWSAFADDIDMDTTYIQNISSDKEMYIKVNSFFNEHVGTYGIEIFVTRTLNVMTDFTENTQENDLFSMFPNPATTAVTINHSNDVQTIELINAQGQIVHTTNSSQQNQTTIHTGDFENGHYVVRLTSKSNSQIKSLIIVK